MTVQCLTCARADLRGAGKMAAHGFALCALRPKHEFYPFEVDRECQHHQPATAPILAARSAWLDKKASST
jgi:hypothetical protein